MVIHCSYDQIEKVKDLKPHPQNPNRHSKAQIQRLAEILEFQGWRRPIRVSELSGYIIAGHGALAAAKLNKWTEVPVDYQEYESEDHEYADMVADNALHDWVDCGIDLGDINANLGTLGPDLDPKMMGMEDFEIEIADRFEPASEDEQGKLDKTQTIICPHCGKTFDKSQAKIID